MTGMVVIGVLIVIGGFAYIVLPLMMARFAKYRGRRLVTCPETNKPAAVEVDAFRAALSAVVGHDEIRLQSCSRWPERAGCGQECLRELQAAPEDCLVRTIVKRWYEGKKCALCHRSIDTSLLELGRLALMSPERMTMEWRDLNAEALPEILSSYQPLCWSCHIAEKFRREHPELVIDRPHFRESA
jgi:hypothetical protein